MFRDMDRLYEGFRDTFKKSKEECGDELEKIRQLISIIPNFNKSVMECYKPDGKTIVWKYLKSLVLVCYFELYRISEHILFLSCNGLYRNAFDNVRHALESIVQALYIDHRHPKTLLSTKIDILKEVEDKREYHAVRLIDELEIHHKDKLKKEYKRLSQIVHPSHKEIIATMGDMMQHAGELPVTVDCERISGIYDSMRMMYDIFFFLFIHHFPKVKEALQKNPNFIKDIKVHNLTLLSRVLKT